MNTQMNQLMDLHQGVSGLSELVQHVTPPVLLAHMLKPYFSLGRAPPDTANKSAPSPPIQKRLASSEKLDGRLPLAEQALSKF